MGQNDRFANIAASGINSAGKSLITPHIRNRSDRVLLWKNGPDTDQCFTASDERGKLTEQMKTLRGQYVPFLRSLAPEIATRRSRKELNTFQWRVIAEEDKRNFPAVLRGEGQWEVVSIPHYSGPLGKVETVYRTTFTAQPPEAGEAVFICFGGVDYKAHVFFNGRLLGSHEGLFAPFEFDATDCVLPGENTLVVSVENDFTHMGSNVDYGGEEFSGEKIYAATGPGYDDPAIGWHHCPPAMGIYQAVFIETRPRSFLSSVYARPLPEQASAELHMEAFSCDVGKKAVSFRVSVYGKNFYGTVVEELVYTPETGRTTGLGDTFTQAILIAQNMLDKPVPLLMEKGVNYFSVMIPMGDFRWWELETPWLYEAQVQLLDGDGRVVDTAKTTFGMRSFTLAMNGVKKGMPQLNGKPCRLRGANTMGFEQQDVMRGDWDQLIDDILLAKACHMNFLRLTQRPVQEEVYAYCDSLGLMTQTDLPLFGVLRRNQFAEAARQAEEMERLVRNHPCNILLSYINEPFPNANNQPHRHLVRSELMEFFTVADKLVHLQNPDRVIKHVDGDYDPPSATLPDNHCYTCWYNGHGLDAGALHRGDWLPVKRGWYYACGEFGAEGLDPADMMRRRYPAAWLPKDGENENSWSPSRIVGAQSGNFHYFFYETPHTLQDWADRSREYQAEAVKWMTEAFRRNGDMVSFALHLFIDAFPSGWMKTIMDAERTPKPAYFAYRDALTPTMVSLRTDRFTYFAGQMAAVEVWLCNDRPEKVSGAQVVYEALLPDGSRLSGKISVTIDRSSAYCIGELHIPTPKAAGTVTLRCAIVGEDGEVLHRNSLTLRTYDKVSDAGRLCLCTYHSTGPAAQLLRELDAEPTDAESASAILIDRYEDYEASRARLDALVQNGGRLIFLNLPAGKYLLCGKSVTIRNSSMMPMHFVSRDTGHPWVKDFGPKDFRFWYEKKLDRITPLLDSTFTQEAMTPVLLSGNTDEAGQWGRAIAVGEMAFGKGSMAVCQLKLAGRVRENPVAWIFAQRMLRP